MDQILSGNVIWVLDTCAIIWLKHGIPSQDRRAVLKSITNLVEAGKAVFPEEVFKELERYKKRKGADISYEWAKSVREQASRYGFRQAELAQVMAHPIASRVVDPEKLDEEADPHIIALALYLKNEFPAADIRVVTEERRDRINKKSVPTACAVMGLISMPTETFLEIASIWTAS